MDVDEREELEFQLCETPQFLDMAQHTQISCVRVARDLTGINDLNVFEFMWYYFMMSSIPYQLRTFNFMLTKKTKTKKNLISPRNCAKLCYASNN